MALYDFTCKKCGEHYEALVPMNDLVKYKKVSCPNCKSKSKIKEISNFDFAFNQSKGTDRWSGSHDYRFKENLPKVKAERENASKKSHMGTTNEIYRKFDDFNSNGGNNFGEVK